MTATTEGSRRAIYLAVTDPGDAKADEVTIESAEPRIVENTAEATFDFFICSFEAERKAIIGMLYSRRFQQECPSPVRAREGSRLHLDIDQPEQLVMSITVHRPGKVRVHGADLTYTQGWRRSTEAVGPRLEIRYR